MINTSSAIVAVVGLLCAANLWVSISVGKCQFYSPLQKSVQIAIIWLFPILGCVCVWSFLRAQYNWQMYDTRAFPEPAEKMRPIEIEDALQVGSNAHHQS
ncbi:hypothetical protein [Uliginosibacterium sediminicola]|uniref:hypothetical protein n=1 Tax=Uliginosibacterium sediminicola TaxID=2024550 RepID=UPI0031F6076A